MELWIETEVRVRRDQILAEAARSRHQLRRRRRRLRATVADTLQRLSDALARIAALVRGEARTA